jgi:hypothetical protein
MSNETRKNKHSKRDEEIVNETRKAGKLNFMIKNINDLDDKTLDELDKHQTQCWKEKDRVSRFSGEWVKRANRKFYVVFLRNKVNKIIFSQVMSIQVIDREDFVYLRGTCISPEEQNKGIYKESLNFIKIYFGRAGFHTIRLNASMETVNGVDHHTRLKIFHKAGFEIEPITINYRENNKKTKTIVKLKSGEFVKILSYNGKSYKSEVIDEKSYKEGKKDEMKGKGKTIDIEDIDFCYITKDGEDFSESEKYVCPMVMVV